MTATDNAVEDTATSIAITNPLMSREVRPIVNWCEWLNRWATVATVEEMLGLLHVGFNISMQKNGWNEKEYSDTDRIIFYLQIADGWASSYDMMRRNDEDTARKYEFGKDRNGNTIRLTSSELRQKVATKAFDILCLNFFKEKVECFSRMLQGDERTKFFYRFETEIVNTPLFPTILNFFRIGKERFSQCPRIQNLSQSDQSHTEKESIGFLLILAEFVFGWAKKEPWHENEEEKAKTKKANQVMCARLESIKSWMIEVLFKLGRLDVLEKYLPRLNKVCLDKLREIALLKRFSQYSFPQVVDKDRQAETVEEACYLGSKAGWLIQKYGLHQKVSKKLTGIMEAKKKIEEAERNLKKLAHQ